MDGALTSLAHKGGLDPADLGNGAKVIDEIPFDSANRFNAVLAADGDGARIHAKDAPHRILNMCDHHLGADGPAPLNRADWNDHIERQAERGQRVLAFAVKNGDGHADLAVETLGGGFTLLGIVGFDDPPRPDPHFAIRMPDVRTVLSSAFTSTERG